MSSVNSTLETNNIDPNSTFTTFMLGNSTLKNAKDIFYNGTGYYIEDEVEPGLNDLQTLFLACFATLIPLLVSLLTAFGIRILWTRYQKRKEREVYDEVLERRAKEECGVQPLHTHLLNTEKKCEHLSSIGNEDVEAGISQIRPNHSNTNGSIITMTLKNHHLIVETEERNDIEEDSRETTIKYSPGVRDGVFVVEVQQGGLRRSPTSNPDPDQSVSVSDQCALVHNPPNSNTNKSIISKPKLESQTGLSQSEQSLNSYCYGNQQGYEGGRYGYPSYIGYTTTEETKTKKVDDHKPKITAAVFKNRSKTLGDDDDDEDEEDVMVVEVVMEEQKS